MFYFITRLNHTFFSGYDCSLLRCWIFIIHRMYVIVKENDRWMLLVNLDIDVIWNYYGSSKGFFIYCFAYHFYFMHVLGTFHFPRLLWGCRSWILFWWNIVLGFKLIAKFLYFKVMCTAFVRFISVDFLVIICWDVILMATRRDLRPPKKGPDSTVSEPHAHCCTWGYCLRILWCLLRLLVSALDTELIDPR